MTRSVAQRDSRHDDARPDKGVNTNEVPTDGRPLTLRQAATWLQLSELTVRRMVSRGDLRAYKVGPRAIRIDLADLKKCRKPVTNIATALGGEAGAR